MTPLGTGAGPGFGQDEVATTPCGAPGTGLTVAPLALEQDGPGQERLSREGTPYHYVVVRDDLPRGFLAAHIAHAAGESANLLDRCSLPENTHAVILAVPNEAALLRLAEKLAARSIVHKLIREPDAPHNGAATAIGLAPTSARREVRRVLSNLPLLK